MIPPRVLNNMPLMENMPASHKDGTYPPIKDPRNIPIQTREVRFMPDSIPHRGGVY
jgi:hypothetical protein